MDIAGQNQQVRGSYECCNKTELPNVLQRQLRISTQALNAISTTKTKEEEQSKEKKKTTGSQKFMVSISFSLRTLMYQFPQAITQCAPIRTRAQLQSRISNKLLVDTKPDELLRSLSYDVRTQLKKFSLAFQISCPSSIQSNINAVMLMTPWFSSTYNTSSKVYIQASAMLFAIT